MSLRALWKGGPMKKPIVVSVTVALMLLAWSVFAPSYAQDPAKEENPTFYRLTPGIYMNGWPRFTITYPKDWVERPPRWAGGNIFAVSSPNGYPELLVVVFQYLPGRDNPDFMVPFFKSLGYRDVTVVSEKPSQLRDDTPAREVEFRMVINGAPAIWLGLTTKRGDMLVRVQVITLGEKVGENLKAILYSLEFQPGKDEPVKVPPDVQEFLDSWRNALVSHDVAKVMTHYSDRFLESGIRKGEGERFWRQAVGGITSWEIGITDFIPAGDRVYLTGFINANTGKYELRGTSPMIKENGEWKWYGNQRDVAP
jgi:hypothetical protein